MQRGIDNGDKPSDGSGPISKNNFRKIGQAVNFQNHMHNDYRFIIGNHFTQIVCEDLGTNPNNSYADFKSIIIDKNNEMKTHMLEKGLEC